jgi:putative transcriptional regulator
MVFRASTHIHHTFVELLLLMAVVSCAASKSNDVPERDPIVGKLLVASPSMPEPLFRHTVILIVQHDSRSVLGIAVNRPVKEISLSKLEELMGQKDNKVKGSVPVLAGGPVEPDRFFVLHSTDYHRPETVDLDQHVAVTSSPQIFLDIGEEKGPQKSLIAFGYVGWSSEQLEYELVRNEWFIEPESSALIFDDDRSSVWDDAVRHSGIEL